MTLPPSEIDRIRREYGAEVPEGLQVTVCPPGRFSAWETVMGPKYVAAIKTARRACKRNAERARRKKENEQ